MTVGPGRQAAVTEGLGGHRRDLDGLRGLALLVVVALHLDLLGGGFVGVDVFFVLSGFLVTSSMLRSPLSYSSFVARRVRRLVPASSAVAVLCVLASHVLSLPGVLRATRTAAVFCAAQSGNLFFAFLVPEGYFAASPNPLLHYWSLGVEEHFYLLWPWLLPVFSSRPSPWPLLCVAACSFASSHLMPSSLSYYLLVSRGGEMLLGCAAALFPPSLPLRLQPAAGASGLLLIALSASLFSSSLPFPGVLAVVPCAGALLIICCSSSYSPANRLLSLFVAPLGPVSYSAYLVHQPVHFFLSPFVASLSAVAGLAAEVAVIAVSAVLLYFLVERRFRYVAWSDRSSLLLLGLMPCLLLLAVAAIPPVMHDTVAQKSSGAVSSQHLSANGWHDWRSPQQAVAVECNSGLPHVCMDTCAAKVSCAERAERCLKTRDSRQCFVGSEAENAPAVLLIGDSHAAHYLPALQEFANVSRIRIFNHQFTAVPPLLTGRGMHTLRRLRMFPGGDVFFAHLWERVVPHFGVVILGGMWFSYARWFPEFYSLLYETALRLTALNKTVVLLGQVPLFNSFPTSRGLDDGCPLRFPALAGKEAARFRGCVAVAPPPPNQDMRKWAARQKNVYYFDVAEQQCPRQVCSPYAEGVRCYWHTEHLTQGGSRRIALRMLRENRGQLPPPLREAFAAARPVSLPPHLNYYSFIDGD